MSDNKTSDKLLPCPFCSGEAILSHANLDWFVRCNRCFCKTRTFKSQKSAILTWNNRKPMQRIVKKLEDYRDDFMHDVYEELRDDSDNLRANRIIERFDEAIEIVKEEMEV